MINAALIDILEQHKFLKFIQKDLGQYEYCYSVFPLVFEYREPKLVHKRMVIDSDGNEFPRYDKIYPILVVLTIESLQDLEVLTKELQNRLSKK